MWVATCNIADVHYQRMSNIHLFELHLQNTIVATRPMSRSVNQGDTSLKNMTVARIKDEIKIMFVYVIYMYAFMPYR